MPLSKGGGPSQVVGECQSLLFNAIAARRARAGAEPLYVPATQGFRLSAHYASCQSRAGTPCGGLCLQPVQSRKRGGERRITGTVFSRWPSGMISSSGDECYADIYFDQPPASALPKPSASSGGFTRLLTFHSCPSDRPARSAFRHGGGLRETDRKNFRAFRNVRDRQCRRSAGRVRPAPGGNETMCANRAAYADGWRRRSASWESFRQTRPGAFFCGSAPNGTETALRLWRDFGVRVLPGPLWGGKLHRGKAGQTLVFLCPHSLV